MKQQTSPCRSERDNASKQTRIGESQHVVLCVLLRTYQNKFVRTCMQHPGCFPRAWRSLHLQVTCLQLKRWTIYYFCHSVPFFLVSESSGRNRPLREAPCIDFIQLQQRNTRKTLFYVVGLNTAAWQRSSIALKWRGNHITP